MGSMKTLWDGINSLYSIQLKFNGVTFTFWQMFIFFALLSLAIWGIKKLFIRG